MNHKGELGEQLAREMLEKKGYRLIKSNFSTRMGEIDLIMMHRKRLVFVEVKSKRGHDQYRPVEAINPSKLKKLYRTAQFFLLGFKEPYDSVQMDVCEVYLDSRRVEHIENIDFDIIPF